MAEFQEVIKQFNRMCSIFEGDCEKCEIGKMTGCMDCAEYVINNPVRAEEIIMTWAAEHPPKTMKDVLLEKFPNALIHDDGEPKTCAELIGFGPCPRIGGHIDCAGCWQRPAPEE